MIDTLKREKGAKLALIVFLLLTVWWVICPSFEPDPNKRFFGDFSSIYAVMALLGGVWGVKIAGKWGGMKSLIGRAILFLSFGLLAQVFGQLAYAYYSFFLNVSAPYPSIGDLGYFGSIPLYVLGIFSLAKASGVNLGLRSFMNKIQAMVIPFIILTTGYWFFLKGYEFDFSSPVKIFLDFGYPLGQAFYVSLAILTFLLSKKFLGGIMRNKILFLLAAFGVQFLADYNFLYQSSRGTWANGGYGDYLYLVSYFVMTLALLQLETVFMKLKEK